MKIIEKLQQTTYRDEKIKILRTCNDLERKVFYYAYNPYLKYQVKNINKSTTMGEPNEQLFELLENLNKGFYVGDEAREKIYSHMYEHGNLIAMILKRSLECGVGPSMLLKAFGKTFIPTFKLQQAKNVDIKDIIYPAVAELKYDGLRIVTIVKPEENTVTFYTRNGHVVDIPELAEAMLANYKYKFAHMLDGELTYKDGLSINRPKLSGELTSALAKDTPLSMLNKEYTIFDNMPERYFHEHCNYSRYKDRRKTSQSWVELFNSDLIQKVESKIVNNPKEANDYFQSFIDKGLEGIIIKDLEGTYEFKRSKSWAKVKAENSADLKVIGTTEGKGKFEGMIGSLICEGFIFTPEGSIFVETNVSSGLSDFERQQEPEFFIDKIVEITYNTILTNAKGDGFSLFIPKYKTLRSDK